MKLVKYTTIAIGMVVFTLFTTYAIIGIYEIYTNFGTRTITVIPATVFILTVGFLGLFESIQAIKHYSIYKENKDKHGN